MAVSSPSSTTVTSRCYANAGVHLLQTPCFATAGVDFGQAGSRTQIAWERVARGGGGGEVRVEFLALIPSDVSMKDTWKLGAGHTQQVAASLPGLHGEDPAAARLRTARVSGEAGEPGDISASCPAERRTNSNDE